MTRSSVRPASSSRRFRSKIVILSLVLLLITGAFGEAPAQAQGVALVYFRATAITDHVLIEWETASEQDVVGFNVQRSLRKDGGFVLIGDTRPSEGNAVTEARYSLIDNEVAPGTTYYYWLEVISHDGAITPLATASVHVFYSNRSYLPLIFARPFAPDSFWADRYRLDPGECTTLNWSVTSAQGVYLNDIGVTAQGVQLVCPAATTTYVLRIVRASATWEYQRTIAVGSGPGIGVDANGHFYRGNPKATVKLEEFMDFQCPYSARHAQQTGPLLYNTYVATGEVLHVFRNFPLDLHSNALPAAKAAYCAGQQAPELFWTMYDWLFKNQGTWAAATDASAQFRLAAVDEGVDGAQYDACIADPATEAHIQGDLQEGAIKGVSGTPNFFIDNCRVLGAQPFEQFQETIEKAKKGLCQMIPPPQCPDLPLAAHFGADPARPGFTYDGSPTAGAADARLVLVSFEDFKSAGGAKHARTVEPILRSWYVDPGQLRLVSEPFPDTAPMAATAALCAAWQGKFWEYRNLLYQKQGEWQEGDDRALSGYAGSLGLDVTVFGECLSGGKARAAIDCALAFGREIGVPTTPSFQLIKLTASGEVERAEGFAGAQTLETFVQAIRDLTSTAAAAHTGVIPRFPAAAAISFEMDSRPACRIWPQQEKQALYEQGR